MAKKKSSRKKKKSSKSKRKPRKKKSFTERKVIGNITGSQLLTILSLVVLLPLAIYVIINIGTLGSLIEPPTSPIGEFNVSIKDSRTGEIIENATYDLIYFDNEGLYDN